MLGVIFGLGAGLLYAASTVTARVKVERDKADIAVLYTLLVNNLIFITIIMARVLFFDYKFVVDLQAFGMLALSGLFGPLLGRTLLFASSERIGASKASCIKILSPVFSAVIALIFLREIIPWTGYVGILIVVFGLYWLHLDSDDSTEGESQEKNASHKIGTTLAFGCAIFYSLSYIFRKTSITVYPYPLEAAAIEVFFAMFYYLIYFAKKRRLKTMVQTPKSSIKYFIYSGLTGSCALFSYFFALQFIPVTIGATLVSTQAFFAILLGTLFKGADERLTYKLALGSVLIFLGVTLTVLFQGD